MLENYSKKNQKNDIIRLILLVFFIIFVIWNILCWGKQIDQISLLAHRIKYQYLVYFKHKSVSEYKYHRNLAVYYARLYDKDQAYKEINLAFRKLPKSADKEALSNLYRDKALIEAYFEDYKHALSDYFKYEGELLTIDKCRIGIMFKFIGNNKYAVRYCNEALMEDSSYYIAWACLADTYANVGKYDVAVKLYDLYIEQTQRKNARIYADRARYKKLLGDIDGYNEDIAIAKSKNPAININISIIDETMRPPKGFSLIEE